MAIREVPWSRREPRAADEIRRRSDGAGRTFKEALMKALRSLDTGKRISSEVIEPRRLTQRLVTPQPERLNYIRYALPAAVGARSSSHDVDGPVVSLSDQ